ncbi:hypothetical protein [Sphingobacterium sp. JUb56]|uniref:hypothetical protein n=1 Tax=Sphingobacterium sp. JUb56 TaxID=2587145 RepID=UPI001612A25D|nr:hypothetical protein [Sphingobacterium sp. JUb56]MBB2954398.1 hypothetical protein [Sphingobacterium sp. JUb56]
MKKIKLFSAIGLLAFLSIAADFNNQKSDILGNNPIQIFKLQELSTPRELPHLRIAKPNIKPLERSKPKLQVPIATETINTTKGGTK